MSNRGVDPTVFYEYNFAAPPPERRRLSLRQRVVVGVVTSVALVATASIWGNRASDNATEALLERRPAADEVCVDLPGVRGQTHVLLHEADEFADGTDIGPIADAIGKLSAVDRDAAICRPHTADSLDANRVVPADHIPANQLVTVEVFESHDGYSRDIG